MSDPLFNSTEFFDFVEARRLDLANKHESRLNETTGDPAKLLSELQNLLVSAIADGIAENNRRIMEMLKSR